MGKLPELGSRTAVAKSMEDAISRHYNRLKEMENQKKLEQQDFKWRLEADQHLISQEKAEKLRLFEQYRADLRK